MQFWIDGWFTRLLLALAALTLHTLAGAQSLNPAQEDFRLQVSSFNLTGIQHPSDALEVAEINRRLLLERARFPQTMSVDELHQVADALTLFLRNSGFVFHTVYLPPQRVDGGIVEMRVQEGTLAGVHVINQTRWPDQRFQTPFRRLQGKILYGPEVEEMVQALKAQGGFRVFAFYSRGAKSGEAILNLRVDPTAKRAFNLRADNYGSPSSGEQRVVLQYSEYQLTGHHDRLAFALLRTVDDVPNTYGSIAYLLPFGELDYAWDLSASNNQFEVGDRYAALGLEGDASTVRTGLTMIGRHHPDRRSAWRLGAYEKSNNLKSDATSVADEVSRVASLQWNKTLRSVAKGAFFNGLFEYGYGQYEIEGLPDGEFNKLDLGLLLAKEVGQRRWRNLWQLSVRGQYSDGMLPSIEGFGLTGAYGVRGFAPGLFNADSAALASLEWRFPNLIGRDPVRLEPFLIAEYANGRKEDSLGVKQDGDFSGAGLGLNFMWGRRFSAQVVMAKSASGEIDGVKVADDDQILFEIRLQ